MLLSHLIYYLLEPTNSGLIPVRRLLIKTNFDRPSQHALAHSMTAALYRRRHRMRQRVVRQLHLFAQNSVENPELFMAFCFDENWLLP